MKARRNVTVAVVLGLGLLLPALASRGGLTSSVASAWATSVVAVDESLADGDISAAMRAWEPAHRAALADRRWEGLVEVGDARMRIERASAVERNGKEQARVLYLMALFRARDERSAPGLRRVAGAFAVLGDREVAARAGQIAATLERWP